MSRRDLGEHPAKRTPIKFNPDWVVAPGETLADWFEETGMPHTLAPIYGIEAGVLTRLLAGDEPITEELAEALQRLTRVGARFWLALEQNYRVGLAAGKKRVG